VCRGSDRKRSRARQRWMERDQERERKREGDKEKEIDRERKSFPLPNLPSGRDLVDLTPGVLSSSANIQTQSLGIPHGKHTHSLSLTHPLSHTHTLSLTH